MGNDGGSIPDRRDLVKTKQKAEQADKANQTRARWGFCALSKKPLQEPVVACRLGRLYNKDALIEFLLDPTTYGDGKKICGHVKGLKDIKVLTLAPNPVKPTNLTDTDLPVAQFVCPLTMKEMNGAVPFVYLLSCGCVFSQTGLRALAGAPPAQSKGSAETSSEERNSDCEKSLCPQCGDKYDPVEDAFTINPGPEEELMMMERLATYKASTKGKLSKKRKAVSQEEIDGEKRAVQGGINNERKKAHVEQPPRTSAAMVSRSKKVAIGMAEQEKKRQAEMTDAVKSIYQPAKAGKSNRPNWISQGTFTRYAA